MLLQESLLFDSKTFKTFMIGNKIPIKVIDKRIILTKLF